MKIDVYWSWKLPQKLPDLCLVTDVYAATGNMAYLLTHAKRKLFLVNDTTAVQIKHQNKAAIIIGESQELPLNFFAVSNDPKEIAKFNFPDQDLYYMSINGTKVIEQVFQRGAKEVIALSFLNINHLDRWLNDNQEEKVAIIAAGQYSSPCPEDIACAKAMETILSGEEINWENYLLGVVEEFKLYYPQNPDELNKSVEIIFNIDSLPIIPVCQFIKPGLIEVVKG